MKLFLGVIAILACSASWSQQHIPSIQEPRNEPITRFGFKAGFNRSHVTGKDIYGNKTGYIGGELYAGFFAETRLNKKLRIGNEVLFSWTNDYHFVEIPIFLKYQIANNWLLFAGPKLEVLLDNDNNDNQYRFNNAGFAAESGVQLHFGKRFLAEIRHSRAFIRQIDDLVLDINGGKRNTTRIGLGVTF